MRPTPTGPRKYTCHICSVVCFRVSGFAEHMNSAHGLDKDKPFSCGLCGKNYGRMFQLEVHERTHTGEKPYRCSECPGAFSSSDVLWAHRFRIHVAVKRYCCDLCDKRFLHHSQLVYHKQVHEAKRSFSCDLCGHTFILRSHMLAHKKRAHDKKYECTYCSKRFATSTDMRHHISVSHTGEKPYQCSNCSAWYSSKASLLLHTKAKHIDTKKYSCAQCGKSFSVKYALTLHSRTHTGEKNCECSVCHKRFAGRSGLNQHMKTHMDEKQYKCSLCDHSTRNPGHLQDHIMRCHTKEQAHSCEVCGKRFTTITELKKHSRCKTLNCRPSNVLLKRRN